MDQNKNNNQNKSEFNDILRDIFCTPLGELLRRDREKEEQKLREAELS